LLTTVAPQQFGEGLVEPDGRDFLGFGSTNKPKGLFVEPDVNALTCYLLGQEVLIGPSFIIVALTKSANKSQIITTIQFDGEREPQ
jgi:hypothetical protein